MYSPLRAGYVKHVGFGPAHRRGPSYARIMKRNMAQQLTKSTLLISGIFVLTLWVGAPGVYAQQVTDQPAPAEDALAKPVQDAIPTEEAAQTQGLPTLSPPTEAAQASDPSNPLQKYLDQSDPEAQKKAEEALPTSATVRIRSEGFNLGGERSVTVDTSNPNNLSREELQEEIRKEAFDAALTGLFPLQPNEIEGLLKHYDDTERAAQTPVYSQPKPEVSVQTISMDPGVTPPTIKTAVGHVTTLNILDITGAPWPVQDITWAGDFEIIEPEEGGHIIRITPMAKFAYGNMSVRLLTLKTPITFALRSERDSVHYRVDARIPEFGPFAEAQLIEGSMTLVAGSSLLTSILDGVAPAGAERLEVSGVDGRTTAYRVGALTYVRTPLTLLSPGWESS